MDELIAKLEAADKGSASLSAEIWQVVAPKTVARHRSDALAFTPKGAPENVQAEAVRYRLERAAPAYTESIDAALTLVPEKMARLVYIETCVPAKVGFRRDDKSVLFYEAATPALALCIAALKARQQAKS